MPRKKTREIKIRHLKCFGAIWEELGFISRSDIGIPGEKYFVIEEVISQLGKLKGVK